MINKKKLKLVNEFHKVSEKLLKFIGFIK